MEQAERVMLLRECSAVERCHTLPHVGSYSVGKHSYDAAMLLLQLHPGPSLTLVRAVLEHDLTERWLGDVPRTILDLEPDLYQMHNSANIRVARRAGFDSLFELKTDDWDWLRAVDTLEFILWCDDQLALGNRHVEKARSRAYTFLEKSPKIPEVTKFLEEHEWNRTSP